MKTDDIKRSLRRTPLLGATVRRASLVLQQRSFRGSQRYWEQHYAAGGTSGEGSTGALARFKADVLNDLVASKGVNSVVEFGCGDGEQLGLADYPLYLGLDVSRSTLVRTAARFAQDTTKSFLLYDPYCFADRAGLVSADLALSLDVIYHLVEDDLYRLHLEHVFGAGRRLVVLFTSDADTLNVAEPTAPHVRHRGVVRDVRLWFPDWRLVDRIPNRYAYQGSGTDTSFADFFVYERR